MRTYQELVACGQSAALRADFVMGVIGERKNSDTYRQAAIAQRYAKKENVTISNYRKLLYDINGSAVPDNYSANHKCAAAFFPKFVLQEVQYLLGNGCTFEDDTIKDKLQANSDFDNVMQEAARYALVDGVCYGFRNLDHVELFRATEFAPVYDEENGAIMAGVRWWQVDSGKPLRCTLYEIDGYTDYIRREGEELTILREKRAYKLTPVAMQDDGTVIYNGENYPTFPIVPLYGNYEKQSELIGIRETIDCYDLILSGFANDLDEASMLYWTLENCGGMDDIDLAKFKQRMRTVGVANLDGGDSGAKAESHTIDVPYESRKEYLDILERRLYDDAMAFDYKAIASGAATATQIKAAYTNLNLKANQLEYCVNRFIQALCNVAGIDDTVIPTYKRDSIINEMEATQAIMLAANYLDDETIINKLPFLTPDEVEACLERRNVEGSAMYTPLNAAQAGAEANTGIVMGE